ncbi:Protein of unknown function [Pseudomonas sp. NFPP07]|uniref:DUF3077 domain-containing protein n=1 Tax=Pseudomonas sp. NFPP07 TaxID=1566213 RepID=UPI0008EBCC81|nr:DUF3077 domain-containing protein [Pseudomonas sp. NFPP07]SFQ83018.1 Protein of unknown function [Pseudomonas sp. NFPP07]
MGSAEASVGKKIIKTKANTFNFLPSKYKPKTYPHSKHASNLFYYAKKLMLDAAMEEQGERYAWSAYYLCEMGKAVVDDISNAISPSQ